MNTNQVRSLSRLFSAGLVILVGMSGCSDDSGAKPVSLAEFPEAAATALCQHYSRCAPDVLQPPWLGMMAQADLAACVSATMGPTLGSEVATWVAAGLLRYDAAAAGVCLARLADHCDALVFEPSLCAAALVGLVPPGGACDQDLVCAGDAFCDRGEDSEACAGACRTRVALGEACERTVECSSSVAPSWCDGRVDVCVARPTIIEAVAGAGEPCGVAIELTEERRTTCQAGFTCAFDSRTDREFCTPTFQDGDDCSVIDGCGVDSRCVWGEEGAVCHTFRVANTVGEACKPDDESQPLWMCNPFKRLQCGPDDLCRHLSGEVGSACLPLLPCNPGLYCTDWDDGVCATLKADGETCSTELECASGYCTGESCAPPICE